MEIAAIALFCAALILCGVLGISVLWGLAAGLVIFCVYALVKRHAPLAVGKMIIEGVKTGKSVLIVFLCIGILTGLWRSCGTIPALVALAANYCIPQFWPLLTFLFNAIVSFLIGTSFGTAATMGVVCMMMGNALGADPMLMGGAIFSGIYFGDRCSPVSSAALLVAELTGTTVPNNIPAMFKSAAVPTLICIVLYGALGYSPDASAVSNAIGASMAAGFDLNPVVYLPALAVLVLSLFRLNAVVTLLTSSAIAFVICLTVQGLAPADALWSIVMGFTATGSQASVLDGGGIVSMINPGAIVCIASAYAGIFAETGMLRGLQAQLAKLSRYITPFGTCCVSALATTALACNQTLATMLTYQLYGPIQEDGKELALELEDTVLVMSPLIPWSIAATVPISCTGAPAASVLLGFLLYLIPLCHLIGACVRRLRSKPRS